jgi:hypothetical protein
VSILADAAQVARGERPPTAPAAAYRAAALAWAERCADEGESPTVALARLCAKGSPIVSDLYRAAAIAHALDALDLTELVPPEAHEAANRLATWAALLELVAPLRATNEHLNATVRRLLGENLAVRALFILILQEPRPHQ